jgi:S1-C subfamily serine protease
MARALEGGLKLHKDYPQNKEILAGKRGKRLEFKSPEQYPKLKQKYTDTLNYEGDVVASCIHCHQIGEARREFYWQSGKPIPEKLLFSYPHPKSLGLILDPNFPARVKDLEKESIAASSGLQIGDDIRSLRGQPILSMADVQWVLHNAAPDGDRLAMAVSRGGRNIDMELNLDKGWRRQDDISWRVTAWTLCRMMLGGMRVTELDEDQRTELGIEDGQMALRVKSAGKYGQHGLARRSGFLPEDIIVSYDGQRTLASETALFAYANEHLSPGKTVTIEFIRGGKRQSKQLKIQR